MSKKEGQALRIERICSSDIKFKERLNELRGYLIKRGCQRNFIDSQYKKVNNVSREDLLF